MTAQNYDPTPVKNPQKGDVGIYGSWKKAKHSVTAWNFEDGKLTNVATKGGILPGMRLPPGPGKGMAWSNEDDKLNFYRRK